MTFAELLEEVMEAVSLREGGDHIQRGEVKRLLNLAMREISLLVGLPTHYIDVPDAAGQTVTGSFRLPGNVHPEGIRYVEVAQIDDHDSGFKFKNRQVMVLTPASANEFYPGWEDENYCGPPFVLYNAADPESGFRPVGFQTARYRMIVHANPVPMVEELDEPFAIIDCCTNPPVRRPGATPSYHRVLSHFVIHELLRRIGDHDGANAYYTRYMDLRQNLFANIEPPVVFLPRKPSRAVGRRGYRGDRRGLP